MKKYLLLALLVPTLTHAAALCLANRITIMN